MAVLALLLASASAQDTTVKQLIAQLGSSDERTRVEAASQLGNIGRGAARAAPALVKALGDDSNWVSAVAFEALKKIGPDCVPSVVKGLRNKDDGARLRAIRLLDETYANALDHYLRQVAVLLKDEDRSVRESAAHTLGQQGEQATDLLVNALGAREAGATDAAISGLVAIGAPAVEPLVRALAGGNDRARAGAAKALGALKAKDAGQALLAALSDKSPEVGGDAALALGKSGGVPGEAIPRLLEGLRSPDEAYRGGCVDGLVCYGEPARAGLVAALDADDTRAGASLAILRGGEMGVAALLGALAGESLVARHAALAITRRMNPVLVTDGLVAAVALCLEHADPAIRADAARTLAGLGPRGKSDRLAGAASDPDASVRAAAVFALGMLGEDPGHVDDADAVVRIEAQLAGWRRGGAPGAEGFAKIALDAKAETRVREAAVTAIGDMGIAASSVDLTPLFADQPVEIRRAAALAIARTTQPSAEAIRDVRTSSKPDKAVEAALDWLAKEQGKAGEWDRADITVGTSGLALLAFLGAGHGPNDPKHGPTVKYGLSRLILLQDKWGTLSSKASHEYLVCHGIATIALVEAWIFSRDDAYRRAAQRALDYIAWARNPDLAWRYAARGGENDTHVTTWMLTALRLGDAAGLDVDAEAYEGAAKWIDRMTGPEGRTGYNYPGGACARPEGLQDSYPPENVETMTAAGLWCRQLLGGEMVKTPSYKKGIDLLLALPPRWSSGFEDHIYWNLGSLVLFQEGDSAYSRWEKPLSSALASGHEKNTGAWRADDVWSNDGGKVYTTSMAVLTMLAPTRYPRDFLTKPKMSAVTRAAITALKKARSDEDEQVREIATAACDRLGG